MLFVSGKVLSDMMMVVGNFRTQGTDCGSTPAQSTDASSLTIKDHSDIRVKIWTLSLRKMHLHKKCQELRLRSFALAIIMGKYEPQRLGHSL